MRTLNKDGTWRAIHDELHRAVRAADGRAAGGRADEPTACSLDAPSVQSAERGEQIGSDKFTHCRGRNRNLVVDTLGFIYDRTVTSATVSDRVTGRDVLTQAKDRRCARDDERLVETPETMIDLAMIDVMGNRLAGGTRWRNWRTMIGTEPTPQTM